MRRMLYYAYGADLDPSQMRQRCPQARYVNKARLDGYALCFPRWSDRRLHAVASIEEWRSCTPPHDTLPDDPHRAPCCPPAEIRRNVAVLDLT